MTNTAPFAAFRNFWSGNVLFRLGFGALVVFLMLFFAAASVILPWWFVLIVVTFPLAFIAAISMPIVGIVVMLVLVCGLVPDALSPSIKLGAGQIKAHELFILFMLLLAMGRQSAIDELKPYVKWLMPVFCMLGLVLVAVAVAFFLFNTAPRDILSDARNYLGWLILFCLVGKIRTRKQLSRLQIGLVIVGLLVAAAALLQFFTGHTFVQNARVEELTSVSQSMGVVRSIVGAGNYFLIFALFLLLARMMTGTTSTVAALPLVGFLAAGLVVNFGRGLWLSTFGGAMLLAFWLIGWRGVWRLAAAGVFGLAVALGALALYKPHIVEAAYERLVSTTSETLDRDTTLGWRLEEVTDATEKIVQSPFVGIGLGTSYKPVIRMNGRTTTVSDEVLTRYIHNAYVGLWLKFGILGLVTVAILIWHMIRRGLVMEKQTEDPKMRALALSIVAGFIVPTVTSFTQPEWLDQTGVAFFAVMLALQIILHRQMTYGDPERRSFGIPKMPKQASIRL